MEISAADQQLLVSHYSGMGVEASHPSFGSMVALMTSEQDLGIRKAEAQHAASFMCYNDPYHVAAFQAKQSGMPDEGSAYNILSPVSAEDVRIAALQDVDHGIIAGGEGTQKMKLQRVSSAMIRPVNKRNIKAQVVFCEDMQMYSQGSCCRNERGDFSAGSEMEDSACRIGVPGKGAADDLLKEKIRAHPEYHKLVTAYINCRKVGAPLDVARRLEDLSKDYDTPLDSLSAIVCRPTSPDRELDHFMETYCHALYKYERELSKPLNEAMAFLQKVELQMNHLRRADVSLPSQGDGCSRLSKEDDLNEDEEEEEGTVGCGEVDFEMDASMDPQQEDKQLKEQLLKKYRGYISKLKHEFMKKKKKGKLPKDARQQLLDWWNEHYKWPYPTETEKETLAETSGLDQKQINNWFINQRKRHWKPSDQDVSYVMAGGQDLTMQERALSRMN